MREINCSEIIETVKNLCMDANYNLGDDVLNAIKEAREREESPTAKAILDQIIENNRIAREEKLAICQDTGFAVFFVELGQDVKITGGDYLEAFNEGTRQGYKEGYLRKSIVDDPVLSRINTKDNTPCIVYTDIVPGDKIKITFCPKGGGAENMAEVKMLTAAHGIEGVKDFVIDRVRRSSGNPCPPIVVGVGIGGTFEKCAMLAKKALLREPLGKPNTDSRFAAVEKELLERINNLGIGPMGLGGRTTALAVHIETYPCHIATMPCAVNLNCHASRHKSAVI
ncbi:MAG TPA: fumarate hydratase [bacterium (Candidatus Stahlbacteria)]|nr:fumarate hydratase [Candidatus Stahlbacteria bacterium]